MSGFISDDEMDRATSGPKPQGFISDDEMDSHMAGQSEDSGGVLHAIGEVGKAVDSYTGAPVRSAIGALQDGKGIGESIGAYAQQFGADPATAPTGRDIAKKAGVSDESRGKGLTAEQQMAFDRQNNPGEYARRIKSEGYQDKGPRMSNAQVAGFGVEMAADPLNLLPVVGPAKRLIKGAEVAEQAAKGAGVLERAGQGSKAFAEKAAVNATGATGVQASKFEANAGRELLDRKIVRFGDSQSKIAERASEAVEHANQQIDSALKNLDAAGVKVDGAAIRKNIEARIGKMKTDPSKADIAGMLESELTNLDDALKAKGEPGFLTSEAEQVKRGYNRKAGNWMQPEKGQAGKETYQAYREEVEQAARNADPATAAVFEEGKKSHGLLAPIQEAAERRASTTAQSPPLGLADITSAGAGLVKDAKTGFAAPIARRLIGPRISSTLAVTADKTGDALLRASKFKGPPLPGANSAAAANSLSRISDKASMPAKAATQEPAPGKGPEKWAADGIAKLGESLPADVIAKAKADPQGKRLLIAASDLKPGSKAMADVAAKLKARFGKGS